MENFAPKVWLGSSGMTLDQARQRYEKDLREILFGAGFEFLDRPIVSTHDDITVEIPAVDVEGIKQRVKEAMKVALNGYIGAEIVPTTKMNTSWEDVRENGTPGSTSSDEASIVVDETSLFWDKAMREEFKKAESMGDVVRNHDAERSEKFKRYLENLERDRAAEFQRMLRDELFVHEGRSITYREATEIAERINEEFLTPYSTRGDREHLDEARNIVRRRLTGDYQRRPDTTGCYPVSGDVCGVCGCLICRGDLIEGCGTDQLKHTWCTK